MREKKGVLQSVRNIGYPLHVDVFNLFGDSNISEVVWMSFVQKTWKNSGTQTLAVPARQN